MGLVRHAVTVESADALLPQAQALLDRETERLYREQPVSCGPACNACCAHAVVVTGAEARMLKAAVGSLPLSTQARIAERARGLVARLDAQAFAGRNITWFDHDEARRYFSLGEPCPLLIDGACAARAARPLACREYLVSSDPEHCADPGGGRIVKIRRRQPVDIGFRRVSDALHEPERTLLPYALVDPAPLEPTGRSASGTTMAQLLLAPFRPPA